MTTTAETTRAKSTSTSVATSTKFKTFAIVGGIASTVTYLVCEIFNLPLFTFHPATNRVDFGWAPGRSGEGPAMYWYGWTASAILGGVILGALAILLPERAVNRIPLWLLWALPILAIIPLAYNLMPFWTKG